MAQQEQTPTDSASTSLPDRQTLESEGKSPFERFVGLLDAMSDLGHGMPAATRSLHRADPERAARVERGHADLLALLRESETIQAALDPDAESGYYLIPEPLTPHFTRAGYGRILFMGIGGYRTVTEPDRPHRWVLTLDRLTWVLNGWEKGTPLPPEVQEACENNSRRFTESCSP